MNTFKLISIGIVMLGVALGFVFNKEDEKKGATSPSSNTITTSYSVSVVKAEKKNISENFSLVGTIVANNDVIVLSETSGRVVKVDAEVGDYKKAGSVLVEADSELKEAAYKAAKMTYEKAKKDLDRYEALYKEGSISDSQIEQARWSAQTAESQYIVARRQFNDTKVTTPISGIVTARFVNVGSTLQGAPQATQVAEIVDISSLKAKVNVAEKDVFKLNVGDKVQITTDIFPNTVFSGKISTISDKGDDAHTYPVEVVLNNSKKQLKAGMFAQIMFEPKTSGNALIVPREAIIGSMLKAKVYIINNNIAKLLPVTTGQTFGTSVEILKGLNEGDVVVVNGQNNLKDNANVIIR